MSWNTFSDDYFRATSRTFTYFFLPEDYDFSGSSDRTYNIYTFETATRAIERVVKNYEAINSFSVDTYQHYLLAKGAKPGVAVDNILPVSLKLQSFTNFTENGLDPRLLQDGLWASVWDEVTSNGTTTSASDEPRASRSSCSSDVRRGFRVRVRSPPHLHHPTG